MNEALKNFGADANEFIIKLVIALLIFVIGFRIVALLEKGFRKEHKFSKLDKTAKGFLVSFITIGLKVLLIVIALSVVGVPTASLITVVGSCAVAIGLALQGGLSNIAGGLMILIFKPFKVGDYIEANSMAGTVKNISIFYTTIVSPDNKVIQLPNGTLSNSNIINYSSKETRRVDLDFGVSYKSDIDKVKKIINDVIEKNNLILKDQDITIRLKSHDASALIFTVRVWTNNSDYWNVYFYLMEEVKNAFDKNNIEIPFNQLDVHLDK